jgi:hypothetical protein
MTQISPFGNCLAVWSWSQGVVEMVRRKVGAEGWGLLAIGEFKTRQYGLWQKGIIIERFYYYNTIVEMFFPHPVAIPSF